MRQLLFDVVLTLFWCCFHLLLVRFSADTESSGMAWELILSVLVFVLYPWLWLCLHKHLRSISKLVMRVGLISLVAFSLSFVYLSVLNNSQDLFVGLMFSGGFFISITLVSMLFLLASAKVAQFVSRE